MNKSIVNNNNDINMCMIIKIGVGTSIGNHINDNMNMNTCIN